MQAAWAVIPRGATTPQVYALTFGSAMNNPPSSTANIPKNLRPRKPPDVRSALSVPRLIQKSLGEPFPSITAPLPLTTTERKVAIKPLGSITIWPPTWVALLPLPNSLTTQAPTSSSGLKATRSVAASRPSSTTPSTARSQKALAESDAAPPKQWRFSGVITKDQMTGGLVPRSPSPLSAPHSATRSVSSKTKGQVHPPGSPTDPFPLLTKRKC